MRLCSSDCNSTKLISGRYSSNPVVALLVFRAFKLHSLNCSTAERIIAFLDFFYCHVFMLQKEELDKHNNQITPPGFHLIFLPFTDDLRKLKYEETPKGIRVCQN